MSIDRLAVAVMNQCPQCDAPARQPCVDKRGTVVDAHFARHWACGCGEHFAHFAVCPVCFAGSGQPCIVVSTGRQHTQAHPGRPDTSHDKWCAINGKSIGGAK